MEITERINMWQRSEVRKETTKLIVHYRGGQRHQTGINQTHSMQKSADGSIDHVQPGTPSIVR